MSGSAKDIYSNTIEVFIESPTTVKIYCNLKEAGRGIAIYDDTFTKVTGCEYTETEQQDRCITFTVSNSGTYYIGSTNSGITIYGIEIIY